MDAAVCAGKVDIGGTAPSLDAACARNCGQVSSPTLAKFQLPNAALSWVSTSRIWSSSVPFGAGAAVDVGAAADVDGGAEAFLSLQPVRISAVPTSATPMIRISM